MAKKSSSSDGEILHCVGLRLRATGSGNLETYLRSLDDVRNIQLADLALQSLTNREPVILANFQEQKIQIEFRTTEIDETFRISKLVLFVKPIAEGYPVGV
jgi:hypothetical protein